MDKKKSEYAEYVKELTNVQGISVTTVSDGWVFMFTQKQLEAFIESSKGSDHVVVFVKNSSKQVQN